MSALPRLSSSTPWGYKLTISAYFAGEITDRKLDDHIENVTGALPEATFVGMAYEDVADEPYDQGSRRASDEKEGNE